MNTRKIFKLERKARLEAEKAVNAIYKKYNAEMHELIAQAVPKGLVLGCVNGMTLLMDKKGNTITSGRAWGVTSLGENDKLNEISFLQYTKEHLGGFKIKTKIKGKG
jgi:hypothetical protein